MVHFLGGKVDFMFNNLINMELFNKKFQKIPWVKQAIELVCQKKEKYNDANIKETIKTKRQTESPSSRT